MIALLIGLLVIALDQITKIIIVAAKPVGTGHGFIEFNLTYNTGAAFSFMDDNTLFLAILSLIATIILIYIAFKHFKFRIICVIDTICISSILGCNCHL